MSNDKLPLGMEEVEVVATSKQCLWTSSSMALMLGRQIHLPEDEIEESMERQSKQTQEEARRTEERMMCMMKLMSVTESVTRIHNNDMSRSRENIERRVEVNDAVARD